MEGEKESLSNEEELENENCSWSFDELGEVEKNMELMMRKKYEK